MSQKSSGRRSARVTAPEVARSMARQYSDGIEPRDFHIDGVLAETPMADARAAKLPAASAARSSAFMGCRSVTHGREFDTLTDVKQPRGAIMGVKTPPLRTLGERLKFARESAKLSQADLAKKVKSSPGSIGNYEANTRKSAKKVAEIALALGVRALWLESGTGPMREAANNPNDPGTSLVAHQMSQRLPIVPPRTIVWEDLSMESFESPFGLEIKDDALLPRYAAGLMGCFVPGVLPEQGDAVMVETPDKRLELRFYQPGVSPGQWAGVSPTPGYGPLDSDSGCRVVAVMAWATRKSLYAAMR